MERKRRWLALLLALVLAVGLLPTAALATDTDTCTGEAECTASTHDEGCKGDKTVLTRAKLAEMLYQDGDGPFKDVINKGTGSAGFNDIGENEEESGYDVDAINALANAGILSGTAAGTFNPTGTVTRAELAVVFWRVTGSKSTGNVEVNFSDVFPSDWFAPAVTSLFAMGLISGTNPGGNNTVSFDPNGTATIGMVNILLSNYKEKMTNISDLPAGVTRAEMAVAAYNKYKDSPYAKAVEEGFQSRFNDLDGCTPEQKAAIWFLEKNEIVQGENDVGEDGKNPFNPNGPASNIQIAAFLMQCAQLDQPESEENAGETVENQGTLEVIALSAAPLADDPTDDPTMDDITKSLLNRIKAEFGEKSTIASMAASNPNAPAAASAPTTMASSIQVAAPTITFADGKATIAAAEGADIYCTTSTDGTPADPTINESQKYTQAIELSQGMTVKAIAVQYSLSSAVAQATYQMTIKPRPASLTGGGTVTFTITDAPASETVSVTCDNTAYNPSLGADDTWSVTLPNASATYTFTATAGGGGDAVTAECTVAVTRRSSTNSGGSSNTTTTTERNPDGSTTTTTTNKTTGTVTETTRYPDGSREVVETKKDGTVTTTSTDAGGNQTRVVENPDGSTETTVDNTDGSASVTTEDWDGQVTVEAVLPSSAVSDAGGGAVALPMPAVRAEVDRNEAPAVTVDLPRGASVLVEIPVENAATSTVALLVRADGTEEIVKTSLTTENGVAVSLSDGDTVKIVDNGKTFYDVPGSHWGAEAIDFVTSRELFGGTSEAVFSPETAMSRGMLVTVLARLEGVDAAAGDPWYAAGRRWAVENGVSDGTGMDQALTREQLAAMLWRYAGSPLLLSDLNGFVDADSVSAYAADAMAWAVEQGLIGGVGDQRLNPQGSATRAQVAAILQRYISLMNG